MISKNLSNILDSLGFASSNNSSPKDSNMYSVYNGYLTTVSCNSNKVFVYFNFRFIESDENNLKKYNISNSVSSMMNKYDISDYSITSTGLRITAACNDESIAELLDECTSLLLEHNVRGAEYCSECGNKFGSRNPKKVTINSENYIMCEHCAVMAIEDSKKIDNEPVNEDSKGKAKGVIFSVLGGIIGFFLYVLAYTVIIPWIKELKLGDVRYIFCALGCVVAVLAYFGYRIFCKKIDTAAYVTISISSLIFAALGQLIGSVLGFIVEGGYRSSSLLNKHFWLVHLRNTIPEESAGEFINRSAEFYKLFGISMLFSAIGTAIFILTLKEKSKPKIKEINIETLKLS